jgi:hypothetical protein
MGRLLKYKIAGIYLSEERFYDVYELLSFEIERASY